jgi:EmrB/QacA subfamily drug resistance transporter
MQASTVSSRSTSDRHRWISLVIVCLGQLMIVLDTTIVNVALPNIQHDLHFSQANLTWVINAYLITYGSFLLMAGRLGDLIGRKRVFLAGLVVFTAASAVCAVAGDQTVLIAARIVQGLGGAFASSVIVAIISTEFPEARERATAMSVFTFVAVAGGSIGLLLGGVITESINWHWIFFINLPIGILAFTLGRAMIVDNPGLGLDEGIDILGSVLVTASMMLLVYAIVKSSSDGWGSAATLGFGGAAIAMLVGFFLYEGRVSNPIFPLRVLKLRGLIGSSAVRGLLVTGMFATFFLGAIYFERVRGYSSLQTGLAFLPMTLIVAALSLGITARLMHRFGAVPLLTAGMVMPIIGLGLLTQTGTHTSYFPLIFIAYVCVGLGMGSSFMPLLTVAMADVPPSDAGLASGIVNVSMQMAAALGLAILGTIATDHTHGLLRSGHSEAVALTSGFHVAFAIAAGCVAVGIMIAVLVLRDASPGPPIEQVAESSSRADSLERAAAAPA